MNKINVFFHRKHVGTIAKYQDCLGAFQYTEEWLKEGFSISPFSLPLVNKVFIPKIDPFDGMFGIFADSLPDGWGRLIVDRQMRHRGIDPTTIGNLERLAIVGRRGLGALTYVPEYPIGESISSLSLDTIALECKKILEGQDAKHLDDLVRLGGSSGGARPKIMTELDGEEWIIKFPSSFDDVSVGEMEYEYALCAKECGITVPEVKLFPSGHGPGYFGSKRFDRENSRGTILQKHMLSVSALLETSHRIPNLDYELLMKLTLLLTKNMEECKKLYRLMCFNVFAHNRDDHSKNFSFLYSNEQGSWALSPAYDLTYSNSLGGEHATTIHGNGKNPSLSDLLEVAKYIGIPLHEAKTIATDIENCVKERLHFYLGL